MESSAHYGKQFTDRSDRAFASRPKGMKIKESVALSGPNNLEKIENLMKDDNQNDN